MSTRPCGNRIDCPPDDLLTNFSSETLDIDVFTGIVYGADGCIGRCTSEISQEDADLCARRQLVQCQNPTSTLYPNDPQDCTVSCPDSSSTFTFVVPAATFIATTLDEANAQAKSYACLRANQAQVCFGNMATCCCKGQPFEETLDIEGDGRTLTMEVTSGSLPTGISMTPGSLTVLFSGTPTVAGNFQFTLTATDASGNHLDNTYRLSVIEIAPNSLPEVTIGVPYSYQLTANGGSGNFAWRIVSGTLPDGLTMGLDGLIQGTPTSGTAGSLTFECIDQTCEEADERFFPPRISMTTISTTRIATVIGYPEFTTPSTPPKKYKKLTWAGTSEQTATVITGEGTSEQCAHAKYVYSGTGEINGAGTQLTNYVKDFYQWCPGTRTWPRNFTLPNLGPSQLMGYCWEPDPNTCGDCEDEDDGAPQFDADVQTNSIHDLSDFLKGRIPTSVDKTNFANVQTASATQVFEGPENFPQSTINDYTGAWITVHATHNYTGLLEDEYTEADALANARVFQSNGDTAENTPRTIGYVSRFTSVQYTLIATNLIPGKQYGINVVLYNTRTGVRTLKHYEITASARTFTLFDVIPTPPVGEPVKVMNPTISFTG